MTSPSDIRHDYIIVGAGSAGAALAYRLTENPDIRVLLIEAGKAGHLYTRLPVSFGLLIDRPGPNWRYRSDPEAGTAGREIPVPRGKLLGGSSAINGLVYVRGQPADYDGWAQAGNRGWSWDDVAPIFKRMESYEEGGNEIRGGGGPLRVSEVKDRNPLYDAIFEAAEQCGYRRNPDYNGTEQEGVVRTQATISRGRRMSTAHCYLRPARSRANLEIVTEALTHRLLFDGRRSIGIAYEKNGVLTEARCGREVVLCGGAIGSLQVLELSGIGQPDLLRGHGIEMVHDLPGVGEHFRDHMISRIQWRLTQSGLSYNNYSRGLGLIGQALRYAATGTGFLSLPSAPLLAFLKSRPELETPDIQMHIVPYALKDAKRRKLHDFPSFTLASYQLRPQSLGSIHIRSRSPSAQPAIRFNFLADPIDQQTMVRGLRMCREITNASAMDPYRGAEHSPGIEVESDDAILDWMRGHCETAYHPMGTCRMGPGPDCVVDDKLKVHGLAGLRIADASIMPTMPSGNTNAACIMIGEKAADLIRAELR